ncbi:ketoreductase domain-containing protein [Streptomyces lydicus]|nr:ketoreductase domain-containing protein [Streptomyces lydicus]
MAAARHGFDHRRHGCARRAGRPLAGPAGAQHLVLTGRRGPDTPGASELIAELAELGAEAVAVACDAADREAMAAVLAAIPDTYPLTGVVHAAGVVDDNEIDALRPEGMETVFHGKVRAALVLDELTADLPLEAFVLFSSIAGVWAAEARPPTPPPTPPSTSSRRAAGHAAWPRPPSPGAWAAAGMAARGEAADYLRRRGCGPCRRSSPSWHWARQSDARSPGTGPPGATRRPPV